jgi:hypothetical protein
LTGGFVLFEGEKCLKEMKILVKVECSSGKMPHLLEVGELLLGYLLWIRSSVYKGRVTRSIKGTLTQEILPLVFFIRAHPLTP